MARAAVNGRGAEKEEAGEMSPQGVRQGKGFV